mmetsp:Transcript_61831/g.191564  ORF Transcript_61831/g.191564 Transcript_61831/m.191564 type:complete len:178 (-) Transcript_61831:113-646(-)
MSSIAYLCFIVSAMLAVFVDLACGSHSVAGATYCAAGTPCGTVGQARENRGDSLSLLQVNIQLQRGSVGEISPATHAVAVNSSSPQAAHKGKPQSEKAEAGEAASAADDPLQGLDLGEGDDDEMVAAVAQVSLLQTGITHYVAPGRVEDIARLHDMGVGDDDEALGLLDAAADWARY